MRAVGARPRHEPQAARVALTNSSGVDPLGRKAIALPIRDGRSIGSDQPIRMTRTSGAAHDGVIVDQHDPDGALVVHALLPEADRSRSPPGGEGFWQDRSSRRSACPQSSDTFFGAPLFRAARVLSLAHGGETLITAWAVCSSW
jgi:hypothetical protein